MKEPAKKAIPSDVEEDQRLHRLIHSALERDGSLIPVSPEAVARAEAELENDEIELPTSLATFDKALERANENRHVKCVPLKLDASMEENLARAAREGGKISPDVEARMQKDRAAAEGNANVEG